MFRSPRRPPRRRRKRRWSLRRPSRHRRLPPADNPNPLLAATINVKDHVVATTQHAFAVIGGIPSWIIALGGRISGQGANSSPTGRLVGEPG